jgi:hypothetical protein
MLDSLGQGFFFFAIMVCFIGNENFDITLRYHRNLTIRTKSTTIIYADIYITARPTIFIKSLTFILNIKLATL